MLNSKLFDIMEFINLEVVHEKVEIEIDSKKKTSIRNEKILAQNYRKLFTPMQLWNGLSAIDFLTDSRAVVKTIEEIINAQQNTKYQHKFYNKLDVDMFSLNSLERLLRYD